VLVAGVGRLFGGEAAGRIEDGVVAEGALLPAICLKH
jgi:hypothetical protein